MHINIFPMLTYKGGNDQYKISTSFSPQTLLYPIFHLYQIAITIRWAGEMLSISTLKMRKFCLWEVIWFVQGFRELVNEGTKTVTPNQEDTPVDITDAEVTYVHIPCASKDFYYRCLAGNAAI